MRSVVVVVYGRDEMNTVVLVHRIASALVLRQTARHESTHLTLSLRGFLAAFPGASSSCSTSTAWPSTAAMAWAAAALAAEWSAATSAAEAASWGSACLRLTMVEEGEGGAISVKNRYKEDVNLRHWARNLLK